MEQLPNQDKEGPEGGVEPDKLEPRLSYPGAGREELHERTLQRPAVDDSGSGLGRPTDRRDGSEESFLSREPAETSDECGLTLASATYDEVPVEEIAEGAGERVEEAPSRATKIFVPGEKGVPLDELREKMGEEPRIEEVVTTGSGSTALCTLDWESKVWDYEGGSTPAMRVEVRDTEDTRLRFRACAEPERETAIFDISTRTSDGVRSDYLHARDLVEWSLEAFEEQGAPVEHVESEWLAYSDNYKKFHETIESDGTNVLEAVEATWSGRTFPELGFTEVEYVTIDPPDEDGRPGKVRVLFSRPEAAEAEEIAEELEAPIEAMPTMAEAVRAAAEAYVAGPRRELGVEGTASIPTVEGPMEYAPHTRDWVTGAGIHDYNGSILGDEFETRYILPSVYYRTTETVVFSERLSDGSEPLEGGVAEAFAPGKVVLDVAPGQAFGLHEYALAHPETIFIGVDLNYAEKRDMSQPSELAPGVHLTQGDWNDLQLPPNSVDTLISRWGPFMHGDPAVFLDTMTAVVKEGGMLRFSVAELPYSRRDVIEDMLRERGWRVEVQNYTAVAIKGGA